MSDDNTFRLILLIFIALLLPFGLYCRIRSHTGEPLDRWQEGVVLLFGLRLTAIVPFSAGVAWMIEPRWMSWSEAPVPTWLRWIGLAMVGFGGALLVWTFQCLGRNLTDTVVTRKEHTLVTTGPYRWVRHPFYTSGAIGLIGGSLVTANWFIFLTAIIVFGFLVARTGIEEAKLVERFGNEYRDYVRKTGRFFPRLRW